MAAKKIIKNVKLRVQAGEAKPTPPLGPALGQAGINIAEFCQKFNAATESMKGDTVGVMIAVYEDRTYDFKIKTPAVSSLIFKAAGIEKGSGKPNISKVGKITKAQVKEIAMKKMPDLNSKDIEGAMKVVEGSARSAGITIVD
ncbi:MAG: 50S ribosomal protein L11 [Candidatus Moranbacteria bacterium]|jgi:large subunit ribosomal protein L11|nr:50S ribosomal protein L11 [Candidatus Moranbacteria bacterium]